MDPITMGLIISAVKDGSKEIGQGMEQKPVYGLPQQQQQAAGGNSMMQGALGKLLQNPDAFKSFSGMFGG